MRAVSEYFQIVRVACRIGLPTSSPSGETRSPEAWS
jgi:hypothetical protein